MDTKFVSEATIPVLSEEDKQHIRKFRSKIIPFPKVDDFYNMLQSELHTFLEQIYLSEPFTLFITALPRDKVIPELLRIDLDKQKLISAGLDQQRFMLEYDTVHKPKLDKYWLHLKNTYIQGEKGPVSSKLYAEIIANNMDLEDIPKRAMGTMETYFSKLSEKDKTLSVPISNRTIAEYQIVSNYLSIGNYWYISVPLIQFCEFDGIVHIVLHDKDKKNLQLPGSKEMDTKKIGNIIRAFSKEYEKLIISWDLVGDNALKQSVIEEALAIAFVNSEDGMNNIFDSCGFRNHYIKHYPILKLQVKNNNEVPGLLYNQSQKNAITTILIDSYAHNMSAHSLTALNLEFKQRKDIVERNQRKKKKRFDDLDEHISLLKQEKDVIEYFEKNIEPLIRTDSREQNIQPGIANYPFPMSKELQPLIKFLLEKGAFWSGVNRDYGFGGEIKTLFEILWDEFINNPLYLGTIANTEKISKINFKVVTYEPENESIEGGCVKKKIKTEGVLACIDVHKSRKPDIIEYKSDDYEQIDDELSYALIDGKELRYVDFPELRERSNFVNPGKNYEEVRRELKNTEVFLPGGVVGRHALFTMLENEIRNVKHYHGAALQQLQEENNTLSLVISIQEKDVEPGPSGTKELYKIGIWLDVDTNLEQEVYQKGSSKYLIERRFNMLMQDITDPETQAPRLGGNFQDKVCAAMLFNNRFRSVQLGDNNSNRPKKDQDKQRDIQYFPWIIPATSTMAANEPGFHTDFEMTRTWYENHKENWEQQYLDIYNSEEKILSGRIKKYFHLWKGAHVRSIQKQDTEVWDWENPSRLRFVSLSEEEKDNLLPLMRQFGVIRIINSEKDFSIKEGPSIEAYRLWLKKWTGASQAVAYQFIRIEPDTSPTPIKYLIYDPSSLHLCYYSSYIPKGISVKELPFIHGGINSSKNPRYLKYRSHGIYAREIKDAGIIQNVIRRAPEKEQKEYLYSTAALFEALFTKVAIFDNRVRRRLEMTYSKKEQDALKARENLLQTSLNLTIHNEALPLGEINSDSDWEVAKKEIVPEVNFLVMHLTYIENILKERYGNKVEDNVSMIGFFIEKELANIISDSEGNIRENFVLVITSGRGRDDWWQKLKNSNVPKHKKYRSFITFRPVESIISVVEDNIHKQDDFDLKNDLVKVLFGS